MHGEAAGIRWETQDRTLILTIDRQHRRNALHPEAHHQLASLFDTFAVSDTLLVAIITGAGDKAFAAGADIKVMQSKSYAEMVETKLFGEMDDLKRLDKPVIAAVNGFALGGGCELAMAAEEEKSRRGSKGKRKTRRHSRKLIGTSNSTPGRASSVLQLSVGLGSAGSHVRGTGSQVSGNWKSG